MDMPPNQQWYCNFVTLFLYTSAMSSTLFILNMTFERFYSIILPHKAASFNTVKRAKITIICVVLFSVLFNFSHVFNTAYSELNCLSYAKAIKTLHGQMYYWISFILHFAVPFVSLLAMNIVIIHILRTRLKTLPMSSGGHGLSEGQSQSQGQSMKNSERQIYITLVLVTFGFLILTTPGYVLVFALSGMDVRASAYTYAWNFCAITLDRKPILQILVSISFFMFYLEKSLDQIWLNCSNVTKKCLTL